MIDARGGDLLVSAAAGSGKTAVLVEHILARVTDPHRAIDIDRLLVVTFTRAAAAEMKERIARALEERLQADPDNEHLQRQSILIDHAQISTIDGFCTFVLQNYFHRIDLDPGYRIAEEEELRLLQERVIAELLEEEYTAEDNAHFTDFVLAYGSKKGDAELAKLIPRIDAYADSHPDPDAWLTHCLEAYAAKTETELQQTEWMQMLLQHAEAVVQSLAESSRQLVAYVEATPEAPQAYLAALREDARQLALLEREKGFDAWQEALFSFTFPTLSPKKNEGEDKDLREFVKDRRGEIKEEFSKLQKAFFGIPLADVLREVQVMYPAAKELVRLVRRFHVAYTEAKREQNLLSFSDIEHLALQILTQKNEEGILLPTEAAKELSTRFEEVLIDEYQDSNYLQEALLASVARQEGGQRNRFMVGDVKQSIYGFRQARPGLFLEKMQQYAHAADPATGQCIFLHKNFRSRPEVLTSVNAVFSRLMRSELGGLAYDEEQALYPGGGYASHPEASFPQTELHVIDKKAAIFQEAFGAELRIEAEAQLIADRILALRKTGTLWDAQRQTYRPITYRDCVVLLRSTEGWNDSFVQVLQNAGIPAYAVSGSGFFATIEVTTALHYLRICDNPRQDIPLAAILRSPIVGLSDAELAELRTASPQGTLYEALLSFLKIKTPEELLSTERGASFAPKEEATTLRDKVIAFMRQLQNFRKRAMRTPIHTLLQEILRETGYADVAAAMPAGAQRKANLEMLVERAIAYEKANYHGLFSFIRSIEEMKENRIDFGEVNLYSEEEDIVRVMTIHKSKGLEFPIVFLAGLGKGINRNDERTSIVLHEKYGIGMTAVYPAQRRIHRRPLLRMAIIEKIHQDSMAEELRVLYVAMTRAKEKLILVGCGEEDSPVRMPESHPSYPQILRASSYLDWIRMAKDADFPIRENWITEEALALPTLLREASTENRIEKLRTEMRQAQPGQFAPEAQKQLEAIAAFRYDRIGMEDLPAKITVSELKHAAGAFPGDEWGKELYPRNAKEDEVLSGTARGTAYHRAFAALDYTVFSEEGSVDTERVQQELLRLQTNGILSVEEAGSIRPEDLVTFLESPIGKRMAAAAARGVLRREQPFVLDLPATEVEEEKDSGTFSEEDTVLLQGTIDAYWEEDGAYILVDYKTDRVCAGEEPKLIDRYQIQLAYYARALEQITGITVGERWIYAVELGKEIFV